MSYLTTVQKAWIWVWAITLVVCFIVGMVRAWPVCTQRQANYYAYNEHNSDFNEGPDLDRAKQLAGDRPLYISYDCISRQHR